MASVVFSDIVRSKAPKTSTKTAVINSKPRGDHYSMPASSAWSLLHIARTFKCRLGANLRRLPLRVGEVSLNHCSATRSITREESVEHQPRRRASLTQSLVQTQNTPSIRHCHSGRNSFHPGIDGLLLWQPEVSEYLPRKKHAVDKFEGRRNQRTAVRVLSFRPAVLVTCAPQTICPW